MMEQIKEKITADDYLKLYTETTQSIELIDGEVIMSPAATPFHQRLVVALSSRLFTHVDQHHLGEVQVAPSDVRFEDDIVLQPDIFFVAKTNNNCRITDDKYWSGAPDLCIEILSPSSVRRDRIQKSEIYARNGVREYWIVDPTAHYIEVYTLAGNTFKLAGDYGVGDTLISTVLPDLKLEMTALFPAE